jgi:hypothetical protein
LVIIIVQRFVILKIWCDWGVYVAKDNGRNQNWKVTKPFVRARDY